MNKEKLEPGKITMVPKDLGEEITRLEKLVAIEKLKIKLNKLRAEAPKIRQNQFY